MQKMRSTLLALGMGCLVSATVAKAGSISADISPNTSIGLQPGTQGMTVVFDGVTEGGAFVGQINFTGATGDLSSGLNSELAGILGPGDSFSTYCIEGLQNVYFGGHETWNGITGTAPGNEAVVVLKDAPNPGSHFTSTGTPNQVEEITEFWDRFHDGVVPSLNPNLEATAFQLGIWEIVNDGNIPADFTSSTLFSSGNFKAYGNTDATNLAASWLAQLGTGSYNQKYTVYALTDGGIQDQIFAVENSHGNFRPVPLPAAFPAGLSLMGGLAVLNFRRRRAS